MTIEKILQGGGIGIPEDKQGRVRSWPEMSQYLATFFGLDKFNPDTKFARLYFYAQKLIAEEKKKKAGKLFATLNKKKGYENFKDRYPFALVTIDIAVRGRNSQR